MTPDEMPTKRDNVSFWAVLSVAIVIDMLLCVALLALVELAR